MIICSANARCRESRAENSGARTTTPPPALRRSTRRRASNHVDVTSTLFPHTRRHPSTARSSRVLAPATPAASPPPLIDVSPRLAATAASNAAASSFPARRIRVTPRARRRRRRDVSIARFRLLARARASSLVPARPRGVLQFLARTATVMYASPSLLIPRVPHATASARRASFSLPSSASSARRSPSTAKPRVCRSMRWMPRRNTHASISRHTTPRATRGRRCERARGRWRSAHPARRARRRACASTARADATTSAEERSNGDGVGGWFSPRTREVDDRARLGVRAVAVSVWRSRWRAWRARARARA